MRVVRPGWEHLALAAAYFTSAALTAVDARDRYCVPGLVRGGPPTVAGVDHRQERTACMPGHVHCLILERGVTLRSERANCVDCWHELHAFKQFLIALHTAHIPVEGRILRVSYRQGRLLAGRAASPGCCGAAWAESPSRQTSCAMLSRRLTPLCSLFTHFVASRQRFSSAGWLLGDASGCSAMDCMKSIVASISNPRRLGSSSDSRPVSASSCSSASISSSRSCFARWMTSSSDSGKQCFAAISANSGCKRDKPVAEPKASSSLEQAPTHSTGSGLQYEMATSSP